LPYHFTTGYDRRCRFGWTASSDAKKAQATESNEPASKCFNNRDFAIGSGKQIKHYFQSRFETIAWGS